MHELIEEAIPVIQRHGYDIYVPKVPRRGLDTYLYYSDGSRIAYLQVSYGTLARSTVCIPNRYSGTGFCLDRAGAGKEPQRITKRWLEAGFIRFPDWADRRRSGEVTQWLSLEAFLKRSMGVELVKREAKHAQ